MYFSKLKNRNTFFNGGAETNFQIRRGAAHLKG